jgi:hypothetical protein
MLGEEKQWRHMKFLIKTREGRTKMEEKQNKKQTAKMREQGE